MNLSKCCAPARKMEILGFVYDSIAKSCRLSKEKQQKYIDRIIAVLQKPTVVFKNLEKLVGNLTYAAWISPFGRPFLSVLSSSLNDPNHKKQVPVSPAMRNALVIWKNILLRNKGLSYDFILGQLPRAKNEWFIDATTNFGCGGLAGTNYFMTRNSALFNSKFFGQQIKFEDVAIAYRELLSAVLAFAYFAPLSPSSIVRINVDNQNVVAWLRKSRCSNKLGYRLLAVIELLKLKYNLKVSVSYIKSSANTSADMLSRGKIPRWLKTRGTRHNVPLNKFEEMIVNPIAFWKKALAI